MLTGAEYKQSLQDDRKVWILGEGDVPDLTTHPATAGLVEEYACWYDRHADPAWQDTLLADADETGTRRPLGLMIPRSPDDFVRLGRSIHAQAFVSAGNVTHTPAYGALIALGVLDAVAIMGEAGGGRPAATRAYQEHIAREGVFLTLTGGTPVFGDRFRRRRRCVSATGSSPGWSGIISTPISPARTSPWGSHWPSPTRWGRWRTRRP